MQSYKDDEIVGSVSGDLPKLFEEVNRLKGIATHHVIGKLPTAGTEITINGLVFKVVSFNNKKGTLHLKLKEAED